MRFFTLLLLLFLVSGSNSVRCQYTLSKPISESLQRTAELMDQSKYDSAQYVISGVLSKPDVLLSTYETYLLKCYEVEIMYYNALFDQGLSTALFSMELAKQMKNERFIGNSQNLIGLLLMSLNRDREAVPYFRNALNLISVTTEDDSLSMNYHAAGNLGECYLKLQMPDSAIYFSRLSMEEARVRGRVRGIALAELNIAQSLVLQNKLEDAAALAKQSYAFITTSKHRDACQMLCSALMAIYFKKNMPDSTRYWMKLGLDEYDRPENTDLSRVMFLEQCFKSNIDMKDFGDAQEVLTRLYQLQRDLLEEQQAQRLAVLKDYYTQANNLALAKQQATAQKSALKLRTAIIVALLLVAILLILVFLTYRKNSRQLQRISALQHQKELEAAERKLELEAVRVKVEALYQERDRIASDLHDDIGAALSSIRIYSGAAQKLFESEPEESRKLLGQISSNSAGMMDRMSDIVWSINPKNDSGESLVFRMKSFASELLGKDNVLVKYSIDEGIENLVFTAEVRKNLYLIFKEAINNASKYSKAQNVEVKLGIENQEFVVVVSDDGVGFDTKLSKGGNGLHNMNKRSLQMGGFCSIQSTSKGTTIQVRLPFANISDSEN